MDKNRLDLILYEAANAELDKKVEIFGKEKMETEVENLRNKRAKIKEHCQQRSSLADKRCMLLRREGGEFTNYLKILKKMKMDNQRI